MPLSCLTSHPCRRPQLQGETLREQDSQLDDLSGVVTRTKTVAVAVHDELGLQARLLDDVDAELDSAQGKLGAATRKLKLLLKRSGDCKALLVLLAVIAVLGASSSAFLGGGDWLRGPRLVRTSPVSRPLPVFALALAMRVAPLG